MSFFQQAYEFRKLFRDIEKLTIKCVHLKCGMEYIYTSKGYIYIYIYIYNIDIYYLPNFASVIQPLLSRVVRVTVGRRISSLFRVRQVYYTVYGALSHSQKQRRAQFSTRDITF